MAAFWTLTLLWLFGCNFLFEILIGVDALAEPLGGRRIPIVGVDLTGAFLIALTLFVIGVVAIQRFQRRPKVAGLLTDTESELRKVTWPSTQEVVNASLVVILCVVLIGVYLAVADLLLARVFQRLILGSW